MPGQNGADNRAGTPVESGEEIMDRLRRTNRAVLFASVAATSLGLAVPASAQETFKLGIVTFLSGPAADSFGVPARNGAQFVIDQLNKGSVPSPYEKVGFRRHEDRARHHRREWRRHQAGAGTAQSLSARQCRRRAWLYQLRRLPGGGADRGRAEEDAGADGLRHAAHLRGSQIQLRVPYRCPCHDG